MSSNWPRPGTAGGPEREPLLAAIVDSASRAIVGLDLDGVVIAWNPAAERLFGYSESEVAGRSLAELLPPGRAGRLAYVLERLRQGETLSRYPAKIIRKDGTPVEVTQAIWGIRDHSGTVTGAAAITMDVTEEERLRAQLAAIVESSDEAIIGADFSAVITSWNRGAERMFGYSAEEIIGHSAEELAGPGGPDASALTKRLQRGEELRNIEAPIRRKDGTTAEVRMSLSPIRDHSAVVTGIAVVLRELTEADRLRSQLAAIVESSNDAIIGTDLDAVITSWNRGAGRIFGYTAAEMIGHGITELTPLTVDVKLLRDLALRGEGVHSYKGQGRRKDGTLIDAETSLSPIWDRSGAVIGIASSTRELTEADRLRFQLAAIVESSPDAIIGLDLAGNITSWNPGAERMYGYTATEIVGHNIIELAIGDAPDPDFVTGLLQRGEEQRRQFEARVARKDGTAVDVSVSVTPIHDASGAVIGTAATSRQPTEEEQLRSRLAAIVKSSSDAIIGLDLAGNITSWNPGAERMYGYTAAEMAGRSVLELIPPGKQHDLDALAGRLRRGELVPDYEARALRKDGTAVAALVSMAAIRDRNGALTGTAVVARDITERVRTEAQRREAQERQHEAERIETVGQLAGRVAHDFNNMLSSIMGYGGLVADATAGTPDVRADVEQILDAARRASRLARELLLISRPEPVRIEALDLNHALTDLRGLLAASVGEHITLRFRTAAVPTVLADRGRLEQVVLNLAVNARDAMPEGGTLTFATRAVTGDEPPGGKGGQGPAAELTVSDTGCGMSPEVASHAFEPFFTTKPPEEGTGLGLSTVHSLVTEAGGSVTVESAEGTGTTFRVRLPAAGLPPADNTGDGAEARQGHGERVLVVDDEPLVLEVTTRILERNGYTTLKASAPGEALSLLSTQDIQLMVADTVMPGMQGTTLAEYARKRKPTLPILHISGYRPPILPGQPGDFLPKPFTAQALLAKVREVLDTSSAGAHP